MENAVEAWCRLLEDGRPPSPSARDVVPRCKVGWLERDVAISIGEKLRGKCAVVHKLLTEGDHDKRALSHSKNGAARVYLVAQVPSANATRRASAAMGERQVPGLGGHFLVNLTRIFP